MSAVAEDKQVSQEAENKALVTAFFADVDAGRADAAFARLAPDVAFELIAPAPHGGLYDRDGLSRFFAEVMAPAMAGPFSVKVTGMTAEGERVAVETVSDCVNGSGMLYNNRYHSLFVIRDGQIVALREYLDSAHLLAFIAG
ncbi:MAG: nuclear transport factor 2 family protein [Sphingobium phenoxybenzoativorans]